MKKDNIKWEAIIIIVILIMMAIGLPMAIKHDHYIALLIWGFIFIDEIIGTYTPKK